MSECNLDCFNCIYEDCIIAEEECHDDYSDELDNSIYSHSRNKFLKYRHSKKGKASTKRCYEIGAGKECQRRYNKTTKRKESFNKYNSSEKGKKRSQILELKRKIERRYKNMGYINKAQYLVIKNYSFSDMQRFIEGIYLQGQENAVNQLAENKIRNAPIFQKELLKSILLTVNGVSDKRAESILKALERVIILE